MPFLVFSKTYLLIFKSAERLKPAYPATSVKDLSGLSVKSLTLYPQEALILKEETKSSGIYS